MRPLPEIVPGIRAAFLCGRFQQTERIRPRAVADSADSFSGGEGRSFFTITKFFQILYSKEIS